MGQPQVKHDGTNVISSLPGVGIMIATGTGVPTASAPGYAPGCIFIRNDGTTTSTLLYVNTATVAAATWTVLTVS